MTNEEIYVTRIEGAIRGIRMGTKKPNEVKVSGYFEKLKVLNEGLYIDLMDKYKNVLTNFKNRV
jgi:membrane protease subunit (stomatin/prohibitin family)